MDWTRVVDLGGGVGCPGHFSVRIAFFAVMLSGRDDLAVFDARRSVSVWRWIGRNRVAGLSGPGSELVAGLLQSLEILRLGGKISQLVGITGHIVQFFFRTGVGKELLLLRACFSSGMGLPQIFTRRILV